MDEFMNEYKEKNKAKRVQMTLKPEIVEELEHRFSAATSENQADVRAQCRSTSIHKENLLCRVRHCVCPSQQSKRYGGLGVQKTFE